jgi:hypothetical protein
MPYKDPQKAKENRQKYYQEHKEKFLEKSKEWAEQNPDKRKSAWRRYNDKIKGIIFRSRHEKKYFGGNATLIGKELCEICIQKRNLVIHHKDCNREHNAATNLIVLCRSCHAGIHYKIRGGIK